MNATVYYFSGTGNSLVVARDVAKAAGGALIPIPAVMDSERITTDAATIGVVFPVYHASYGECGVPLIVRRFVGKLAGIGSKYLFAICTHSGAPGATIGNLAKIIRSQGGELAAGFAVQMSVPGYPPASKLEHVLLRKELRADIRDTERRQRLFARWEQRLQVIQGHIRARERVKLETPGVVRRLALTPLLLLAKQAARSRFRHLAGSSIGSFDEITLQADKGFELNERCNGCGVCARVCPVQNIALEDRRPVWRGKCENCYACFQWCPQEAIHGDVVEYEAKYHHPDVRVTDFIRRGGNEGRR